MADPCQGGLSYASDGFRTCALDEAAPCAVKALEGSVTMEQCTALCDASCAALSLYLGQECWIYASVSGAAVDVAGSIFCVRPGQLPPAPEAVGPGPSAAAGPVLALASSALDSTSRWLSVLVTTFLRLPPAALVAVMLGLCLGVILLLAGCVLLLLRPRRRVASDAVSSDGGHGKRQAPGDGRVHRVLVEAKGGVSTVWVSTGACASVAQLRRVVAAACEHLSGGAAEGAMQLECLDEEAGLAITVRPDTPLRTVLSRPTLKATFAERRDLRHVKRPAGPRSKRGRRKGGYALPGLEEDSDEGERSSCALM